MGCADMTQQIMCNHGYHLFKCQNCIDALIAEQIEKQEKEITELRHALTLVVNRRGKSVAGFLPYYAKIIDELFQLIDAANCPQCGDKSGAYYDNYGEVCQCQWCHEVGELKTNWFGET